MNCIVIDDEAASQTVLEHFISDTPVLNHIKSFTDPKEAFKYLQLNPIINILFLDINMPAQSGLEFYKSLIDPPSVIFTTAYPEYAVNAFDLNAVDYLLKPIAYERFLIAINKVLKLKPALSNADNFVILKENKAFHKVPYNTIVYLEALGDYVKVVLSNKTHIVTHSTFSNLLTTLPPTFLRIHKSYCANKQYISKLNGNQISLDNINLPIGQTYKQDVLKALNLAP